MIRKVIGTKENVTYANGLILCNTHFNDEFKNCRRKQKVV
jgi:hypothetical protein